MIGIAIAGFALLILGAIAGRAGRKVGTAIAIALVLGWFGVLAWFAVADGLDGPATQDLALYLMIGLISFLTGSNLASWRASPKQEKRR